MVYLSRNFQYDRFSLIELRKEKLRKYWTQMNADFQD